MLVVRGQDLTHEFVTTPDAPWPVGTLLSLHIYDQTESKTLGLWPAVDVTPEVITLQVDATDLDAIPDGARFRIFVRYPGSPVVCLHLGRIWRQ